MKENAIFHPVQSEANVISLIRVSTKHETARLKIPLEGSVVEIGEFVTDVMTAYAKLYVKIKKRLSEQDQ